jgi:phospholipase C
MRILEIASRLRNRSVVTATILALVGAQTGIAQAATAPSGPLFGPNSRDLVTHTPIKHVIIIIGENWSFDSLFATYVPKAGETVWNLLSEKIIKPDGAPGMSYSKAPQSSATDTSKYELAPPSSPYLTLPPALAGGPFAPYGCQLLGINANDCNTPANVAKVTPFENGLALAYYQHLLTGGNPYGHEPDPRVWYDGVGASSLPGGVYQLTNTTHSPFLPYDSYWSSPVHRLFQMWQDLDCSAAKATSADPSGCAHDLFAWVERTVGSGSNGKAPPSGGYAGEGSTSPLFLNMQAGDAPYLKSLADAYTISDNYHQAVLGGTGANHIMLGTGDAIWFSDGKGTPEVPPTNPVDPAAPGTPLPGHSSALSQVENPDPMPGTNNFYTQDGYGGGPFVYGGATPPNANYGGGSYVGCADAGQHGVPAVTSYLAALTPSIKPNCESGRYYLVNNYNPGYFGDGRDAFADKNPNNTPFTIPPSNVRNIGVELSDNNISWAYFGDQFNQYLIDPYHTKTL